MPGLGLALGAQQPGEGRRILQVAEDLGLAANHREIARCQGGELLDLLWSLDPEEGAERGSRLDRREVVEGDLEGETPQGGGVEVLAEVGGAREG